MSTSKDRRESRRENNVLKETLIGTVNLISYKNDEYSIGTKDGSDINKLKRKDNIFERKHRKKKGKYAAQDKFAYLTPPRTPCNNAKKMCGLFDLSKVEISVLTSL